MTIRISPRAVNTVLLHAQTYTNAKLSQEEWKIVYGYLCGTVSDKEVLVYGAIPLTHGTHDYVDLSEEDYVNSTRVNSETAEKDCFIVGWYHSHPGRGFFLHEDDIMQHLRYQGVNRTAVALVVDPQQVNLGSHGIEIFRLDDPDLGALSGYHTEKWMIDQKLAEFKVEGPVMRELLEKELGTNLKLEF